MDASWPEVIPHLAQAKGGGGCGFRFLRGVLGKFGFLVGIDFIFLFLLDVSGSRLCRLCRVVMPSTHFFIDPPIRYLSAHYPSVPWRVTATFRRWLAGKARGQTTLTLFCELVTSS